MPPPDEALKLYNAKKYALAQKALEKFIKGGTADGKCYLYLAYCYYNQRQYSKAVPEFQSAARHAFHDAAVQRTAEGMAAGLKGKMSGRCPGNCLKPDDPRWQTMAVAGHDPNERWIKFPFYKDGRHGWSALSSAHMGQVVETQSDGTMVNKGTCPICGGTGKVTPLHDGDPLPY